MHSTLMVPFTARDGENLALYEWPLDAWHSEMGEDAPPPRAVVVIVHGLGEHTARYARMAHELLEWGFAVRAYDQRGHGESGGKRGLIERDDALLEDLAEVVDDTRQRCSRLPSAGSGDPLPFVLLGHSLGGLVAARFVSLKIRPVEGLMLMSPAFDAGFGALQKLMLATLPKVAPHLCVKNGLNPRHLSRDPQVVRDYIADPLVHDRISARLARFVQTAGPATLATAGHWDTPTLLMYGSADKIVRPAGSVAFENAFNHSPTVRPGTLTSRRFDGLYHELFNEPGAPEVQETMKAWLDARF
ncbi:MAG: alpha/beta hydrolase [Comamonadaceae bacterium]|nr:MAG: alpha/beta hydrolase [Comamonadaceae bacterium]